MAFSLFSSMRFSWSNRAWTQSASSNCVSINTLREGISTSKGRTTSIQYTNENGVAPVDVRTEVRYSCKAKGASHASLCRLPPSSVWFSWYSYLPPQLLHSFLGDKVKNYDVESSNHRTILSSTYCSNW